MTLLDRANKRYSEGVCSATKRPRRASAGTSRNQCIFCSEDTNATDHSFQKLDLTNNIHDKAVMLGEDRIVQLLTAGDLVAIDARYHRNCYTGFSRRHDAMIRSHEQVISEENIEMTFENELLQFITEEVAAGVSIFALHELTTIMTEKLKGHGITKTVNCTRLKKRVLDHFPDLTEEKGIRDRVFLVCSRMARKIISQSNDTPEEESRILLLAASILRKALRDHNAAFCFQGSFPDNCAESAVPARIKYFFRQLLEGPKSSPDQDNSRKILSVSQLTMLNMGSLSANLKSEPPLAIFLALKLHSQTRSKKLVELLHEFHLCVSYKRVLSIEASFARVVGHQARANGDIVCPTNLRHNIFTVAALDNLDHNPSSRTATSSFHGTGISIFQFPSSDQPGVRREPVRFDSAAREVSTSGSILPRSYTYVPPVGRSLITIPSTRQPQSQPVNSFDDEMQTEQGWMNAVHETLHTEAGDESCVPIMWSSYHAARSDVVGQCRQSLEALLPLFHEKAATPDMILHGMELVRKTTRYLNPHQIPLLVVDQPLYDLSKKMQWTFPETFGEDKFVVMLGGLHIEMALWATMGDILRGSGWCEALAEAGLTRTDAASASFLKAANPMRTRYAHQVTVVVLDKLLKLSHQVSETEMDLDEWVAVASRKSPTIGFWLLIHKYQQIIFMFIRSHRERKFRLMVETLRRLVALFFALDHQNYARWIPILIRDLDGLPQIIQKEFDEGLWAISRSNHRFSSMPIDQAHEQANKRVKGVGGVIGLTENPEMLERWIITGPEISRVLDEYNGDNDEDDEGEQPHHEEGHSSQERFRRHVKDLTDVLVSKGNPFEESSHELVTLDNKVCVDEAAAGSVRMLERTGQEQYDNFRQNVLNSNDVLLTAPIKRNNLLLFHDKKRKKTMVTKRMQHFKQHAELYGQAFVMLDSRGGNLEEFFRHESSPYPPALSTEGSINSCTKSDLLRCVMETSAAGDEDVTAPDMYDFITIDGGMLIHSLPGTSVHGKSFDDYFSNVFCPRIHHELKRSTRVDIVWDQYRETSIKGSTREKRGTGTRQRVSGSAKVPKNWPDFLASAANKTELFSFLATRLAQGHIQYDKCLYITSADEVLSAGPGPAMGACNHEEADTRVIVHVLHALQHANVGLVLTGDTYVVVILLSNFHHIAAANPAADIWIAFKTGKSTKSISLNALASHLGPTTCKAMALFHAFTGCDSTSSFKFKGKRYCYKLKDAVTPLMEEFATIACTPFQVSQALNETAMSFVSRLYSDNSTSDVDVVRMNVFCQKTRDAQRIPPTSDAVRQHLKRSVYQASIWTMAHQQMMPVENPVNHGWVVKDGTLVPVWVTLPLAKDIFQLDVKCACTAVCSVCKCKKAKLKCTRLCKCRCDK